MLSTRYEATCFELGRQFALDLVGTTVRPQEVAFDCDGVLGLFSILDHPVNRAFYARLAQGERFYGEVRQCIMPYFGASHYVFGMNAGAEANGPILVSSMPVLRGATIFRNTPFLRQAFLGDEFPNLGVKDLNDSKRVFFARDLAKGMCVLLDIEKGKIPIARYPRGWWSEIERGILAVHQCPGQVLKLPIVVALSKPGAPKPKIIVDDTDSVVEHVLAYSDMAVVQPSTPWGHHEAFHPDPIEALSQHHSHHIELIDTALRQAIGHFSRERIRVACDQPSLRFPRRDHIFNYHETVGSLMDGYHRPLRIVRQRLGLE